MKSYLALIMIVLTLLISGCETFRGFGRDVESLGKGIKRAGEWVQEKAD